MESQLLKQAGRAERGGNSPPSTANIAQQNELKALQLRAADDAEFIEEALKKVVNSN